MNEYDVTSIFREMEMYLLKSMSNNMKRHTDWEKREEFQWEMWQAKQLQALNNYRKQNKTYINSQSSIVKLKIEELLRQSNGHGAMEQEIRILDAIKKGFMPGRTPKDVESSFFKVNERKLNALINSANQDVDKAMNATLRMVNDEYRKTIFKAQTFSNTGTFTTDQAIDMATKDFLSSGINCIEYANGNRVNIASYAEMVIRTANKRAYLQGEGSKRDEWGIHTVLVSRYGACSETCLPHQGKAYNDDVYSGGTAEEAVRLGYPLLSVAIAGGLFHPNCKHTMSTYFEGVSTIPSKADVAKTRENSDLVATQRYNERQIRKYKRLEYCSGDVRNKDTYRKKVRDWQDRQHQLISQHPEVHRDYKREGLRGVKQIDTTANEATTILAHDGFDIPNFTNNPIKQVVRNTDEEVSNYMDLIKIKTKNQKILDVVRNDMKLMPKRDLDLLYSFKLNLDEEFEKPSHYRKTKHKFIPVSSVIKLRETSRPGTFAHEFAHFAADKTSIYENKEFLDVLKNSVKGSQLIETEFNGERCMAVRSSLFVKNYQGRIYMSPEAYAKKKSIDFTDLKEYISVGYEVFIYDPETLYTKDMRLYNFFEKRGLNHEKKR